MVLKVKPVSEVFSRAKRVLAAFGSEPGTVATNGAGTAHALALAPVAAPIVPPPNLLSFE